jgi:hypothetical protein
VIDAKVVHGVTAFIVAAGVGLFIFAWRDHQRFEIDDRIVALISVCVGLLFGVTWELVEFVIDWVRYSDLQPSNLDTMTDLLWNDVGAVLAGALVAWGYCRVLDNRAHERLGVLAQFLVDGPSRLLDHHGFLMTIVVSVLAALAVGALWFAGRPVPGFPIG